MNILFATNRKFIEPAATMLYSLFESHPGIDMDIYLAYSNLSEEDLERFASYIAAFPGKIFHPIYVGEEFQDKVEAHNHISIESYYRVLALPLLPESLDRILYLDSDLVVRGDLSDLYYMDLGEAPFSAAEDIIGILNDFHQANMYRLSIPANRSYFNTGVMVFNLPVTREMHMTEYIIDRVYENYERYEYNEQDALNEVYYDKVRYIDWDIYNFPPGLYYLDMKELEAGKVRFLSYKEITELQASGELDGRARDMTSQLYAQNKILHYMGKSKPWDSLAEESDLFRAFTPIYREMNEKAMKIWTR